MSTVVDRAGGPPTFEALPRLAVRRRVTRSSIGDPPGDEDEDLIAGPRQFGPSERAHLPRVLTGARVLVVDDDEDTTQLFATALAACGADVVTATSAAEALRAVASQ